MSLFSEPSFSSSVITNIPGKTHIRLLKSYDQSFSHNGITGTWAFVNWYPISSLKKKNSSYEGWIFTGFVSDDYYLVKDDSLETFNSGCLGVSCHVCGSKIFYPDGLFSNSYNCHEYPEFGRWVLKENHILVCIGKCDPNLEHQYIFRIDNGTIKMACATNHCKEERIRSWPFEKIYYWEPTDLN
ncbi:hypothetical protein LEP1GSC037_0298 [Leptospira interrogans str. 2006001854]|uniref:Uncharacterized protein n=1 Tax=Leptospira interrogans str. 2006001854 TaxID=1001590 RepID=M6GZ11_LEPIR|nr:hypothetical protein LEP1GSC037_0298 [Leptospira interrogans str. 2006001854]